ncbi:hypothetical protein SUNI508_00391 [Seiridium unicorne]|uniref:Uncharacterized protein n=1 Tax=Seiridium unicorne TaxID=138068 RepID=A0ABR2V6K3_9PEZI
MADEVSNAPKDIDDATITGDC